MDLEKQKHILIEQLGVCLENSEQLAPLAARIIATLVLTGKKGITFDKLVESLSASKSSISSHLQFLESSGKINYFTKPGDRKRYFIIAPDRILKGIDALVDKWRIQKNVHQNIIEYKKAFNKAHKLDENEPKLELDIHTNYIIFIEEATASLQKLKVKVSNRKS